MLLLLLLSTKEEAATTRAVSTHAPVLLLSLLPRGASVRTHKVAVARSACDVFHRCCRVQPPLSLSAHSLPLLAPASSSGGRRIGSGMRRPRCQLPIHHCTAALPPHPAIHHARAFPLGPAPRLRPPIDAHPLDATLAPGPRYQQHHTQTHRARRLMPLVDRSSLLPVSPAPPPPTSTDFLPRQIPPQTSTRQRRTDERERREEEGCGGGEAMGRRLGDWSLSPRRYARVFTP